MTAPFKVANRKVHAAAEVSPKEDDSTSSVTGNIKVAVRFRPLSIDPEAPKEFKKKNGEKRAWNTADAGSMVSLTQNTYGRKVEGRSVFHFDQVFDEAAQTPLVYKSIARPMVHAALNGKHATIFAYGQTGSGKTFTMQGEGKIGSGQAGIIQLVTSDLFRFMHKGDATHRDFIVKVSYFEIYNEKIRDLLSRDIETASTDTNMSYNTSRSDKIQIRTNANGEIVVNVEQKTVSNVDEALELLIQGNACRAVAATDMNARSSRSHAVFRLTIESRVSDEHDPVESQCPRALRVSDFNLVDLAGSESLKATNANGNRKREGATINKSLLALTTVIQSLSKPGKKRPQHINYRDSKLTRILQPHLSGNADMAILCCASPSMAFLEETRTTLKFAARAKLVQVKPQINEVMDDSALIRKLQEELSQVRKQMEKMKEQETKRIASVSKLDTASGTVDFPSNEIMNEFSASASGFQLDAADPEVARKAVERFQRGRVDSLDPDDFMDSSQDSTADMSGDFNSLSGRGSGRLSTPKAIKKRLNTVDSFDTLALTEDETFDGHHADFSDMSMNMRSCVSSPETIRELDAGDHMGKSTFRGADNFAPNGRLENTLSWDAMEENDHSVVQNETPLHALECIRAKEQVLPAEVTIIDSLLLSEDRMSLTDRLNVAESRIKFLEDKLEVSENAIKAGARDLHRARRCIHDLVHRNVEMNVQLKEKEREILKEVYERGEVMVEQYWLLKASLYISIFFFLSGSHEYFLATVFFVWLAIDTKVTI